MKNESRPVHPVVLTSMGRESVLAFAKFAMICSLWPVGAPLKNCRRPSLNAASRQEVRSRQ